jgi:hypothetical protein
VIGKLLVLSFLLSCVFLANPGFAENNDKKHTPEFLCIAPPGTCYFRHHTPCSGCLGVSSCTWAVPPAQRIARKVLPTGIGDWIYGSEIPGRCTLPEEPSGTTTLVSVP